MLFLPLLLAIAATPSDEDCASQLDRLLVQYREYGLPMPAPDSSLVLYVPHGIGGLRRDDTAEVYYPPDVGFSLKPSVVLDGTWERTGIVSMTAVKPDLMVLGHEVDIANLEFAIQCHARGWGPLSRAAYRGWFAHSKTDAEHVLVSDAWFHWYFQLPERDTPLSHIAKYMKRALPRTGYTDKHHWALLHSLELAVQPQKSPAGSDDALIDELVELTSSRGTNRNDPSYEALIRRGFAAVPALIAHLDDDRLTRVVSDLGGFNSRVYNYRVKDMVFEMLKDLAGEYLGQGDDDLAARYAAVGKWFAAAEKLGEEQYVVTRVLGNMRLFSLLVERYPDRLPGVYRELLDKHPELAESGWQFAEAVVKSPIPANEKHAILVYAATHPDAKHRPYGIEYLQSMDPKRAHEALIQALDTMPEKAGREEARLAGLVAGGTDPDEWAALAKATRRVDASARIELLDALTWRESTTVSRKQQLAFFAKCLTDNSARDPDAPPERDNGGYPASGFTVTRLEVRDFAARQLARILKLETTLKGAELREKVRAAVEKELRP